MKPFKSPAVTNIVPSLSDLDQQLLRALIMQYLLVPELVGIWAAGCSNTPADTEPTVTASGSPVASAESSDLAMVRSVLAELLQKPLDEVQPDRTVAQLGADELDVVEAVMELEDRLQVTISDGRSIALPGQLPQSSW